MKVVLIYPEDISALDKWDEKWGRFYSSFAAFDSPPDYIAVAIVDIINL